MELFEPDRRRVHRFWDKLADLPVGADVIAQTAGSVTLAGDTTLTINLDLTD